MLSYGESLVIGLMFSGLGYALSATPFWPLAMALALAGFVLIVRAVWLYDDPPR